MRLSIGGLNLDTAALGRGNRAVVGVLLGTVQGLATLSGMMGLSGAVVGLGTLTGSISKQLDGTVSGAAAISGDITVTSFFPSLAFNDGRNSQYLILGMI